MRGVIQKQSSATLNWVQYQSQGLPENGAPLTVWVYAAVLISMGLLKSWSQPACNNPIFAEIVPPRYRNLIYAFDRCFEGKPSVTLQF